MRNTFAKTLLKHARNDPRIVLMTADLGFKVFDEFRKELPRQFVNVGVAEQNLISIAAGLSMMGKKVYCYSMVTFLVMRAFEQIRVDICNHNLDVTLVGVGGGLSYGMEGMTHHGFEDISIMRSLPSMTVTVPGDPVECAGIIDESVNYKSPLFIRLGKNNDPIVHQNGQGVKIGKVITMFNGSDVAILAAGSTLPIGIEVVKGLKKIGINAMLASVHTIKPLDAPLIDSLARRYKAIFTVEEHSIIGGLGSQVAESLFEKGYNGKFKRFGLPDGYLAEIGDYDHLIKKCGLNKENVIEAVASILRHE